MTDRQREHSRNRSDGSLTVLSIPYPLVDHTLELRRAGCVNLGRAHWATMNRTAGRNARKRHGVTIAKYLHSGRNARSTTSPRSWARDRAQPVKERVALTNTSANAVFGDIHRTLTRCICR